MEPSFRFGTNVSHWLSQSDLDRNRLASFFTAADVARIASWGMDHLRLPVDYGLFEHEGAPSCFSEEGLSWIDRAVEWTRRAGLQVVYCGEFGAIASAPEEDRLRWYADVAALLRSHGIAMANWDYKSRDFGLVDIAGRVNERLFETLRRNAG